jgi:hypothetical protein
MRTEMKFKASLKLADPFRGYVAKWFSNKTDMNGILTIQKARLVIKSFYHGLK